MLKFTRYENLPYYSDITTYLEFRASLKGCSIEYMYTYLPIDVHKIRIRYDDYSHTVPYLKVHKIKTLLITQYTTYTSYD